MKRFAIVYLSTLVILLPLDFLFLGIIGKRLFDENMKDMVLATQRMTPAILFYLILLIRHRHFRKQWRVVQLDKQSRVWGVIRFVLLCDVRTHQHDGTQTLGVGRRGA
jgi:uncharacterized membrane protein